MGTGLGNRMTGAQERVDRERIEQEYEERQKKGFPCGTHTLFRKRPSDASH